MLGRITNPQTMNPPVHDFIRLYDAAPELSLKGLSLDEKYEALGLDHHHGWISTRVQEVLRERLKNIIKSAPDIQPHAIPLTELLKCREYWFYMDAINHATVHQPYIIAITQLQHSFGSSLEYLIPYSESDRWLKAMPLLKCMTEEGGVTVHELNRTMERQTDRAEAVKRLIKQGARIRFDDATQEMVVERLYPIHQRISTAVEKYGGARTVTCLLQHFATYNAKHYRFTQKRRGSLFGMTKRGLDIPIAYLINLAFNKLNYSGNERYQNELANAIQLAVDVCAAQYDAQTYTIWEDIFVGRSNIDDYFRQIIVWDSLYTIPQSSPVFVRALVQYMLSKFGALGYRMSDYYSLGDFERVMTYLMDKAQLISFTQLHYKDVLRDTGIPDSALRAIWGDVATGAVNAGYITPLNYRHVTMCFYPAIRLPNSDMLLYPASLGAMGWYEVMVARLRRMNPTTDRHVGNMLEGFLHQQLSDRGISAIAGEYTVGKEHGDCDVVVQGTDTILLMELKKKNLTRLSKEGHVFQIITDLAASLFFPQVQAFRTETLLLENGALNLVQDSHTEILTGGNRRVEKLAVSLYEFGALVEGYVIERVLDIYYRYDIDFQRNEIAAFLGDNSAADDVMAAMAKLHKRQLDMRDYVIRLLALYHDPHPRVFFRSGLLSMEQLYYILSQSIDTDDFVSKISKFKYVSLATKDFWAEIDSRIGVR